jgi:hypothetical protein
VDPTVPLPGAGAPGQFPPPTDPWSAPDPTPTPAPPAPASGGASGPVVAQIGEIAVTSSAVHTPAGELPLAGSTWQVSDFWQTEQKTPTWAIVSAIVGFCVLTVFSLLFLLVKQTTYRGTVQVTVTSGTRQYVARIPVQAQEQVQAIHQQVNYVRALAAL